MVMPCLFSICICKRDYMVKSYFFLKKIENRNFSVENGILDQFWSVKSSSASKISLKTLVLGLQLFWIKSTCFVDFRIFGQNGELQEN